MEISYALLCDAANLSQDGQLNVLGAFNVLYAPDFPYLHPAMSLALQIEVEPNDAGQEHEFTLQLIDPDGGLTYEDSIFVETGEPARIGRAYHLASYEVIPTAWHPNPGDYELRILYQGGIMAIVSYEVVSL